MAGRVDQCLIEVQDNEELVIFYWVAQFGWLILLELPLRLFLHRLFIIFCQNGAGIFHLIMFALLDSDTTAHKEDAGGYVERFLTEP